MERSIPYHASVRGRRRFACKFSRRSRLAANYPLPSLPLSLLKSELGPILDGKGFGEGGSGAEGEVFHSTVALGTSTKT